MAKRTNIFGTTVEIPTVFISSTNDEIISRIARRENEREILKKFLNQRSLAGKEILSEIRNKAVVLVRSGDFCFEDVSPKALEHYLSQLKGAKTVSGVSLYTDLMLQILERSSFGREAEYIRTARQNKLAKNMPKIADKLKLAEGKLIGKLRSDIKMSHCRDYLIGKGTEGQIKEVARDLFSALNRGLNEEQAQKFMGIFYELRKIFSAKPVALGRLKDCLIDAILRGESIDIVHMKCFRIVYPPSGPRVLRNSDNCVVDGPSGRYRPKSEVDLVNRVNLVREIFEKFGVKTSLTFCFDDEGVFLLFPKGSNYVTETQRQKLAEDMDAYRHFLISKYGEKISFTSINDLANGDFYNLRGKILGDIRTQGGRFINKNLFQHGKVDHQTLVFGKVFQNYTREEATRSASELTASVIALSKLLPFLGDRLFLVEDDRGPENELIAGGKFPVIFTRLRDEAKYDL